MATQPNTGLGLIKQTIERADSQNNGQLFTSALKKLVNSNEAELRAFLGEEVKVEPILRQISNEKLMLRPRDGSRTIRSSKNVFSYIDSDFKDYGADQKGGSTEEAEVVVHEMEKDANFVKMFASLNHDMDALCMTQDQILEFIEMHRRWLRTDGYATFFLFKSNDQFFVAGVGVDDGGSLEAYVHRLGSDGVWGVGRRHRVVVPQLTK